MGRRNMDHSTSLTAPTLFEELFLGPPVGNTVQKEMNGFQLRRDESGILAILHLEQVNI